MSDTEENLSKEAAQHRFVVAMEWTVTLLTLEINAILFETRIGPSSAREYTATASASRVRLATVLIAPAASHAV